jgi:hypothetical protein
MTTTFTKMVWHPIKPTLPRKRKQIQIRARRIIPELRMRPRVFQPGPYRDAFGNARFLGRVK